MVLLITKSSFRYGHARDLVEYIRRDGGKEVPVKDHTGREAGRETLQRFVAASERHGFERQFIIAPDPDAEYTPAEVDRGVRSTMREWRSERRSTRYVYAVHDSQETPHAHVAVTGPQRQLRMDEQDLQEFRNLARDEFDERERLARRRADPTREPDHHLGHPESDEGPTKAPSTPDLDDSEADRRAEREIDPAPEPDAGEGRDGGPERER